MSKHFLTRGAEGLDRLGWTNADIQMLVARGVMDEKAPMELIRGEIVPMASELNRHFKMRMRLIRHFIRALDANAAAYGHLIVASENSLFLFDDTEFRPDVAIFPEAMNSEDVRGPDVWLAIEVASSSQHRDHVVKPPLYAEAGLKELWVVDLDTRVTTIHTAPSGNAFAASSQLGFDDALAPRAFPDISLRIADFE
jgi:Uma2 family endonuclease